MTGNTKKLLIFVKFKGCNYDQNITQMFDFIVQHHNSEFSIVLYDEKQNKNTNNNIKIFNQRSPEFLELCKKAAFIFCSFYQDIQFFLQFTNSKTQIINVWHGMPIKNICNLYYKEKLHALKLLYSSKKQYVHHIVTSALYQTVFCAAFNTNPENVHILGQVRNNIVLKKNPKANSFVKDVTNNSYSKIILYCPTHSTNNSKDLQHANIFNFEDYELKKLSEFLKQHNYLLLLKKHEIDRTNYYLDDNSNIKDISNDLSKNGIATEHLLQHTDLLITDFSSVYIDYLLLNKPVIFLQPSSTYKEKRGFILDYAYKALFAGPIVNTQNNLLNELQEQITLDSFARDRETITNLVHHYQDTNSAERIYQKFLMS